MVCYLIVILKEVDERCRSQVAALLAAGVTVTVFGLFALTYKTIRECVGQILRGFIHVIFVLAAPTAGSYGMQYWMHVIVPLCYIPARPTRVITDKIACRVVVVLLSDG